MSTMLPESANCCPTEICASAVILPTVPMVPSRITFAYLWSSREWRPIHNCPGRFCLVHTNPRLQVSALIGDMPTKLCRVRQARDAVLVAKFDDGGLISYARPDGTFVHTLNTAEGLARKLCQLGLEIE